MKVTDKQVMEEHRRGESKRLSEIIMAGNLGISQTAFSYRMKRLGLKSWCRAFEDERIKARNLRVLYSVSGHPGTHKDIEQRTGFNHDLVFTITHRFIEEKKILPFNMSINRRSGQSYGAHESLDGIAALNIFYVPGDEHLLGSYITGHLPREITPGMRNSLTYRLKHLPGKAYDVVCDYIIMHAI